VTCSVGDWIVSEPYPTERKKNPDMFVDEEKVTHRGQDGRTIYVVRKVYDSQGNLLRESTFKSTYSAVKEVIEVGTKEREKPPAPPPVESPPQDGNSGEGNG